MEALMILKKITKFCLLISFFSFYSCQQENGPEGEFDNLNPTCQNEYFSSNFLGEYKICQQNEKRIKIELKNPQIEKKYCFIPNYYNKQSNKAIFIGEPRCLFIKFSNKPVEVTFLKNRNSPQDGSDYSTFPINSVMILIDEVHYFPPPYEGAISSVEAYLKCYEFIDSLEDKSYCEAFKESKLYNFHIFKSNS
jgi:hypothetical protein